MMRKPAPVDLSGVIQLRRELIEAGYTDNQIAAARRAGDLHRLRHGAYIDGHLWHSLSPADQHRALARAVLRQSHPSTRLTHRSAAVEQGAPVWGLDLGVVDTTRTDGKAGRREPDRRQHRNKLPAAHVVAVNGVPVSRADRTAIEVCTIATTECALVTVDGLLHSGATDAASVLAMSQQSRLWPRSLSTSIVTRLMDGRHESAGESRFAHLCYLQHVPRPRPQVAVHDGHGQLVGRVDFLFEEYGVFVEFDGREKYERFRREGETLEAYLMREKRREERICLLTGWVCIRIGWADLARPAQLAQRIRAVLASRGVA